MLNKEDDQTFYKKIPFDLDIKKHEELYEDKNEFKALKVFDWKYLIEIIVTKTNTTKSTNYILTCIFTSQR